MKRLPIHTALLTASLLMFGCGSAVDTVPDQRDIFVSYLDSRGLEYSQRNGVFVHVANAGREDYQTSPVAMSNDSVYFYHEAYIFNRSSTLGTIFLTNKREVAQEKMGGADLGRWSFEAKGAKVGHPSMIAGLDRALEGLRQGDSAMLLISSDLAYGSKPMGMLDENTAVQFIVTIETVKK